MVSPAPAGAGPLSATEIDKHLAQLAVEMDYTRPVLDESRAFDIKGGRHPVVESALKKSAEKFALFYYI